MREGGFTMRLTITNTKSSKLLYLTKSVRKDNRVTSETVEKLGKMEDLMKSNGFSTEDEVIEWAKKLAKDKTEKIQSSTATSIVLDQNVQIEMDKRRTFQAGYLFLQDILYEMKFKNILRNIKNRHSYKYNMESIFSDLIFARVLTPCSKRATFESCKDFLEPPKYELHDVYRALNVLAEEDDYIQAELFKNSNFIIQRNNKILYYDCTNYFFEITEEDELRKFGKEKNNRPDPIVQMGLFMDGDGIPLAYNIFPGNQNEQKSMTPTESKIINEFGFDKFIVCTDAGLSSQTNKRFNHVDGRGFIITQSLKSLKGETKDWALSPYGYKRVGDDKEINDINNLEDEDPNYMTHLYYKEAPYDLKTVEQSLIVTYSPKYALYKKNKRDKQVETITKKVESGAIQNNKKNKNDPARFVSKNIIDKTSGEVQEGVKDEYYVDESKIAEEAKYDGFYAVTTDLFEDKVEDILTISERRWEIEESFRIMKTDFEARPVYLQREDRIKAHFLICFVALMVYRVLEKKLNNEYTTDQIISTLREYKLLKISGDGYVPTYMRTELTDKLHEVFGFRTDYQINPTDKIRNIVKNTKL